MNEAPNQPVEPGPCVDADLWSGCLGEITYGPDPYAEEIHGDDTPVWKCAEHRCESARDI